MLHWDIYEIIGCMAKQDCENTFFKIYSSSVDNKGIALSICEPCVNDLQGSSSAKVLWRS